MTLLNSNVDVAADELTPEEGRELFDQAVRSELGVSGDEFVAAYDTGQMPGEWSAEAINRLEFLLPFIR